MPQARRLPSSGATTTVSSAHGGSSWPGSGLYRAGEVIAGKYRLIEMLGEGGMGAVWRAHYETLDVDVALKVLRPDPDDESASTDAVRLLQEARATARLHHPAIARVHDYGVCEERSAFIVMELLEGEDLAHALQRRVRLAPAKAVATLLPIVHALSMAHQKGIVHRDIKPENIFLARGEDRRVQPKLVDFGIAKLGRERDARLTKAGVMLGSPLYMCPEQARGEEVDHLADIWAVCVVLYEIIAGTTPFESETYTGLLYAIVTQEPTPLPSFGFGDQELWDILARGLVKDPKQRWSSMHELGRELARWLIRQGQSEDIAGASLHQRWFQRVGSKADLLESLVPSRGGGWAEVPVLTPPRLPSAPRITDIDVDVFVEGEAEESTFAGGVVPVEPAQLRGRLAAIALASATLGAMVGFTLLAIGTRVTHATPEPSFAAAGAVEGKASSRDVSESEPKAEAQRNGATCSPTAGTSSGSATEGTVPPHYATTRTDESNPQKNVATKAERLPHRHKWHRRDRLKNPFE